MKEPNLINKDEKKILSMIVELSNHVYTGSLLLSKEDRPKIRKIIENKVEKFISNFLNDKFVNEVLTKNSILEIIRDVRRAFQIDMTIYSKFFLKKDIEDIKNKNIFYKV